MYENVTMEEILKLLNDHTLDPGERDDIVMFLEEHGDRRALDSLYEIASNPKDEGDVFLIKGGCGEAIGSIMCRIGCFDMKYIVGLSSYYYGSPLHTVLDAIKECNPKWYKENNLENLYKTPVIKKIKTLKGEF